MKIVLLILVLGSSLFADDSFLDKLNKLKGDSLKLDISYYWDDRDFNTIGIVTSKSNLLPNLHLWGFTDFHSEMNNESRRYKPSRSFSEYRLTYDISEYTIDGLWLQAEYNYSTPSDNDIARFGIVYKLSFDNPIPKVNANPWVQFRYFPAETDGDGWQFSLAYFIPLHERVSISGFADVNFHEKADIDRWVVEAQLNFKITKNFYALIEYRYNEYERFNPNLDGHGVAVGFSLRF